MSIDFTPDPRLYPFESRWFDSSRDASTGPTIPRMRATFPDHILVELPRAKHFIQEDAPDEIAAAIIKCFG